MPFTQLAASEDPLKFPSLFYFPSQFVVFASVFFENSVKKGRNAEGQK